MAYSDVILAESSLVSYWRLGESSGTSAVDSKGANTGTYNGGYTLGQTATGSINGTSVFLNGTNGYVEVPTASSLHPTAALTLEAWICPLTLGGLTRSIAGCGYTANNSAVYDFQLVFNSSSTFSFFVGKGTSSFVATGGVAITAATANAWYHIVGVYDGASIYLYINGTQVATTVVTGGGALNNSAQPFEIGRRSNGATGDYYYGYIDDVALYNTNLSLSAIQAHYAASGAHVAGPLALSGTGNYTDAIWSLCDPTSFNGYGGNVSTSAITTSYQSSASFTPGAITVDGIGILMHSGYTVTTGNITVALGQGGTAVTGTPVTINFSDLNVGSLATTLSLGWVFFKFPSPVTLTATTAYTVMIKASTTGYNFINSAFSVVSMCRFIRTTTSAIPSGGDILYIQGEYTGQGTSNSLTLTWNNTSSSITLSQIHHSRLATITWATATNTYYMRLGGTTSWKYYDTNFNIGSSGTPYPSATTAIVEFNPTASGGTTLNLYNSLSGGLNLYGAVKTTTATTLTSAAAASATSLSVGAATDWIVGDQIVVTGTGRNTQQSELRTITSISGTTIGVAALTSAHDNGAEVIHLTRNIRIKGVSSAIAGAIAAINHSITAHYVQWSYMGANGSPGLSLNNGISSITTDIQYCSFHESLGYSLYYGSGSSLYNGTLDHNVFYKINNAAFYHNATVFPGAVFSFSNNTIFQLSTTGAAIWLNSASQSGATFNVNNNIVTENGNSNGAGIYYLEANIVAASINIDGNKVHSCFNGLWYIPATISPVNVVNNLTINRSSSNGFYVNGAHDHLQLTLNNFVGNGNVNTIFFNNNQHGTLTLKNATCLLDSGYPTTSHFLPNTFTGIDNVVIIDSTLTGSTSGDVSASQGNFFFGRAYNSIIGSYSYGSVSTLNDKSLLSQKHNQVAGSYYEVRNHYVATKDATLFYAGTGSIRIACLTTTLGGNSTTLSNCTFGSFRVLAVSGSTVSVSIRIRKSLLSDGAAYNGTQPNLVVRSNPAIGIYSDTVLFSCVSANGIWELATGVLTPTDTTVLEFAIQIVPPSSTTTFAGWINVDDFQATPTVDPNSFDYGDRGVVTGLASGVSGSISNIVVHRRRKVL